MLIPLLLKRHCDHLDPMYDKNPPFTKLAYVPSVWVLNGGSKLKADDQWPERMFRRLELDRGRIPKQCHPNFGVLFTSTIPTQDLEQRYFDGVVGLPINEFDIISLSEMVEEDVVDFAYVNNS